jgi:predicted component of type VI protein secretion system
MFHDMFHDKRHFVPDPLGFLPLTHKRKTSNGGFDAQQIVKEPKLLHDAKKQIHTGCIMFS